MIKAKNNTRGRVLGALIAAAALLALAAPAGALAAPVVQIDSSHYPPTVPAGAHAKYTLALRNTGDADTRGQTTVTFTVPAGLTVTGISAEQLSGFDLWNNCAVAPDALSASCRGPIGLSAGPTGPGEEACLGRLAQTCHIFVIVKADEGAAPGTLAPAIHTTGGGSVDFDATDPIDVGPPAVFDIASFDGGAFDESGVFENQAGSHPHTASTEFFLSSALAANGSEFSTQDLQDAVVRLPPGLVGNPQGLPTCTQEQLFGDSGAAAKCSPESQVGLVTLFINGFNLSSAAVPVYNMQTSKGTPALLAFMVGGTPVQIYARVRTGEDYGVTVINKNAPQTLPIAGVRFAVWGVPADPSHDAERGRCAASDAADTCPSADAADPKPFFTLPTSCIGEGGVAGGAVRTFLDITGWQGGSASSSFLSHDNGGSPIGAEGCNSVPFAPTLEARPTTNVADSPSGLDVDLRVPQSEDPNGIATAHLRDTTVTLPEGLVINPSGANGLDGCSLQEFGLTSAIGATPIQTTPDPATCPDASKVATVEVESPLVDHPLEGAAYIADPYQNPFNNLLALYITIDDEQTGVVVKLAGKVTPDPNTGQLTATFNDNPQLPFEHFRLHFKSGAHGALRTPQTCGDYTTTSSLTPWSAPDSGPPDTPSDTWAITQSPSGSCATSPGALPHAPYFDAGAVSPIAGAHSPFVVHLRREDGSQNFSAVTINPPQGLVAKLAGTAICPDAYLEAASRKPGAQERATPSCPPDSQLGSVVAGAGAGPAPYYAPGKAYLSGPHKGAPLSIAIVTPATAGPFDLGTIVVKTALYVNSKTAEITAVSDPIPSILQGIPLDVRSVDVSIDKPNFMLNPTSCDAMAVNGLLTSTLNQIAPLSARFQLAECTGLGFRPKMALRLKGQTKRGGHPALTAILLPRRGDANIRSVSVALPRSEFLENAHIRTICTRPDFAADNCPAGAVYGTSTVFTPLLDYPLSGNVYLRSSDNLLPDIVPDLRGPAWQPIRVEAAGRTDSIRGGIRNTFDFFPDAPFTRAVLRMQGGNKGLLVNSRNICARTYRAKVRFIGHNGKTHVIRPKLVAQNCKKKRGKKKGKRGGHRRSNRAALAARSSVR